MRKWTGNWATLLIFAGMFLLAGCQKTNPNDWPVSQWLDDPDPCVSKAARAIIDSGRPYPNEVWSEVKSPIEGNVPSQRLLRYDMWLGDRLYEMPGAWGVARGSDFFPLHHPMRYVFITGTTVEYVLGIPRQKFKDWKVGGSIGGEFQCQINEPASNWIENRAIHAPTREALIQKALDKARAQPGFVSVEVKERDDIQMAEVMLTTTQKTDAFVYVPKNYKQVLYDGRTAYKWIGCSEGYRTPKTSRYDPDAEYEITANCHGWLTIAPGIYIQFTVPQQYLPFIPTIHDKLLQDVEASRKK